MRSAVRRRLRIYLAMVGLSTIVSSVYGALAGLVSVGHALYGAGVGAIQGFVVSAFITGGEIYGDTTRLGRAFERAPFLVSVVVKGLAYGGFIVLVVGGELGVRVLGLRPARPVLDNPMTPLSFTFAFGLTFAVLFVLEISRIVGGRTLRDIVLGRYHHPRPEDRFFLFVDITGSTALAERLGPAAVHRFLDRVFRLAADPVDEHHGEVYQYVGDEMVVTWTARSTRHGAAPVACFFAIARALKAARPAFEREFAAAPRVRGALHAGPVVTGEVGARRRAIVFHGDVVNTTSRIEQATRDLDRPFLASADALDRLSLDGTFALEDLGPQHLRGREAPVRVFAISEVASASAGSGGLAG
jgi:adenylate cyclase